MADAPAKTKMFNEIVVICDESSWVWELVDQALGQKEHVRVPSNAPLRSSWNRFKNAERIIIYWENKSRRGGAVVEEILDIAPLYDVTERVIIVTTDPTHEDVVYCSELGLSRVVRIRNREREIEVAKHEILGHINTSHPHRKAEAAWLRIHRALQHIPAENSAGYIEKIEAALDQLTKQNDGKSTARYYDVMAEIARVKGKDDEAIKYWDKAIELNPNYFRAYNNMISFHHERGHHDQALNLLQRMNRLNNSSVSRMVRLGEIHAELGDDLKAEHYFQNALDRDEYSPGAMNGLAGIRFRQGDLEESRRLLSKSTLAYKLASSLNKQGIEMVRRGKFSDALEHYTKAQYVLPQQDNGPMLFYNIGLCYSRWGKTQIAEKFLRLALIKEPNYKKAQKLLEQLAQKDGSVPEPAVA